MKKVLLVNTNTVKSPYPVPPLGLAMLAADLQDRYEVKVYDGVFDEGRGLVSLVEEFAPDFIGFGIRNVDDVVMDRAVFFITEIIENFIRPVRAVTKVPFILGGSGFSMFPSEIMQASGADYGISGEAEGIFARLLDLLSAGEDPSGLPGVWSGSKGIKAGLPDARVFTSLADRSFPEIDRVIDFSPYAQKGVYSIQTKRGCSHGCIYCTYPVIEGRMFRPRKPADIVQEITEAYDRLGPVTFEFVDSTFNDPAGHAEEICREIIRRGLKVKLRTMGINPRHCSADLFRLMKEAGFVQIDATPDSASPLVLKKMGKGFTLPSIRRMADLIREFDMPTMWFFLFGGPGENETTFGETLDFIDSYINPADLVYMNAGLRVYPDTPLYRIAIREGLIKKDQPVFFPPVYYYSREIGKDNLDKLIRQASRLRPNCLHALETAPSPEMIGEAMAERRAGGIDEPMFRTLLRIRRKWMAAGKL